MAFWPVIDPDIPSNSYCRECLDKAKIRLLVELYDKTEREAKFIVEDYNNL